MPPSSLPSLVAADQLENIHIAAADTLPPIPGGANQPHHRFLDSSTEILIEILKYVLVEGNKLYPHSTKHAGCEPKLERRPRGYYKPNVKYESIFLRPLADILEMGLVAKVLLPVVREVFFGHNCFDLGTYTRWIRGVHPNLQGLLHEVETSLTTFSKIVPPRGSVKDFFYLQLRIRNLHVSIDDLEFENYYLQMQERLEEKTPPREQIFRGAPEVRALSRKRVTGKVTVEFMHADQLRTPSDPGWLLAPAAWLKRTIQQNYECEGAGDR